MKAIPRNKSAYLGWWDSPAANNRKKIYPDAIEVNTEQ